jgi:hypothetical protein
VIFSSFLLFLSDISVYKYRPKNRKNLLKKGTRRKKSSTRAGISSLKGVV